MFVGTYQLFLCQFVKEIARVFPPPSLSHTYTYSLLLLLLQVYGTVENAKILCSSDKIFLDWTFNFLPRILKQLHTIHGKYYGQIFPLFFCLMKDKKKDSYKELFSSIKEFCLDIDLSLKPGKALMDFEASAMSAFKEVFPNIQVKGCFFHYRQCIWGKVSLASFFFSL